MTFPTVKLPDDMDDEEKARIREEFLGLGVTTEDIGTTPQSEQPVKRGRGRPKGARNKRPSTTSFQPIRLDETNDGEETTFPTLKTPPLTTRDQKEISLRFEGILLSATGIAALANPILQMTDKEAQAIAIPLSTYLLRQETTSKAAKQVLEEYDLVAFGLALAAYVVRVFRDFQVERAAVNDNRNNEPTPIGPVRVSNPIGTSTPEGGEIVQQSSLQNQTGEERPVSREYATASDGGWTPAGL